MHLFLLVNICGLGWSREPLSPYTGRAHPILWIPPSRSHGGPTVRCAWKAPCAPCVEDHLRMFVYVFYVIFFEEVRIADCVRGRTLSLLWDPLDACQSWEDSLMGSLRIWFWLDHLNQIITTIDLGTTMVMVFQATLFMNFNPTVNIIQLRVKLGWVGGELLWGGVGLVMGGPNS